MYRNYNKSSSQYRRKLRISLYLIFFYISVVLIQLGNDYRQQKIEISMMCTDIAQNIPSDVSYRNISGLELYFQSLKETAIKNKLHYIPRIAHWQILSKQEIIADNSIHNHSFVRSFFENKTSCSVKNIKATEQLNSNYTLLLTAQFYISFFELTWALISSLILVTIPLIVYVKINQKRELEKEHVLKFISEINQKSERNFTTNYLDSHDITSILSTEAQPILSFIDKTAELSERYDSEYVNRLEKNYLDLEERNAYLSIQNKNLNNLTTLKSSFFANLSHDFRTPLYTIDGYSKLLLNTSLERKQLSHVNAIQIANANLLELVSNFLSLSRLEAGKIDLDFSDVDIRQLIKEITTGLSFLVIEHRNHFFIDISDKLPQTIKTDAIKFRQILANLISNAVKYTHNGILYIHIACREIDKESLAISISITDTGKGISDKDIGTIFDPYTRLDRDKTEVHGTGLGLGICKELCEIIGAKLSVESKINVGSSFIIDLTSNTEPQALQSKHKPVLNKYDLKIYNSIPDMDIYLPEWLKPVAKTIAMNSLEVLLINDQEIKLSSNEKIFILLDYENISSINQLLKKISSVAENVIIFAPIEFLSKSELQVLEPFTIVTNNLSNTELAETISNYQAKKNPLQINFTKQTLDGYVLLLAEDNDLNRKIIEERLNSFGAKVISCPDGSAALELYKAREYHAILMDAHMPKLSGIELTEIIRNEFNDNETPIIGITASTSSVEYQHFIQAGMNDCLIKPLQDQELVEAIIKYTSREIKNETQTKSVTFEQAVTQSELTIQERIDDLSKISIRNHLVELKTIFEIEDYVDMQNTLFNEVHKLNGTLSMTSFKLLQEKVNDIETLINPVLWSTENMDEKLITSQVLKAKKDLLKLWSELEQKTKDSEEI